MEGNAGPEEHVGVGRDAALMHLHNKRSNDSGRGTSPDGERSRGLVLCFISDLPLIKSPAGCQPASLLHTRLQRRRETTRNARLQLKRRKSIITRRSGRLRNPASSAGREDAALRLRFLRILVRRTSESHGEEVGTRSGLGLSNSPR